MFSPEAKQEIVDMMGELFLANSAEISRVLDENGKIVFSVKMGIKGNSTAHLKATAVLSATTKKIADDIVKDLMPNQPKLDLPPASTPPKVTVPKKTNRVLKPEEVLSEGGEGS